ncbi:hypothetical protein [Sorangium sp. So ce176]|uniref:hypothetical protein n=1 Tax=Sorangium sp. So ce176 TaxID=3133286 RepID=UPI003F64290A
MDALRLWPVASRARKQGYGAVFSAWAPDGSAIYVPTQVPDTRGGGALTLT